MTRIGVTGSPLELYLKFDRCYLYVMRITNRAHPGIRDFSGTEQVF